MAKLHKYVRDNEQKMRYDVFRAKGYDIGSGAAEGACKHVVGKRLKQSGMICSRAGSSATLALRVTCLNKRYSHLLDSFQIYAMKICQRNKTGKIYSLTERGKKLREEMLREV